MWTAICRAGTLLMRADARRCALLQALPVHGEVQCRANWGTCRCRVLRDAGDLARRASGAPNPGQAAHVLRLARPLPEEPNVLMPSTLRPSVRCYLPMSPFLSFLSYAPVRTTHRSSAKVRPRRHNPSRGGNAGPPRGSTCRNAVATRSLGSRPEPEPEPEPAQELQTIHIHTRGVVTIR